MDENSEKDEVSVSLSILENFGIQSYKTELVNIHIDSCATNASDAMHMVYIPELMRFRCVDLEKDYVENGYVVNYGDYDFIAGFFVACGWYKAEYYYVDHLMTDSMREQFIRETNCGENITEKFFERFTREQNIEGILDFDSFKTSLHYSKFLNLTTFLSGIDIDTIIYQLNPEVYNKCYIIPEYELPKFGKKITEFEKKFCLVTIYRPTEKFRNLISNHKIDLADDKKSEECLFFESMMIDYVPKNKKGNKSESDN